MKSTDTFKKVIKEHLEGVADTDPLFAEKLKNPKKNIDDCVTYILNQVKASGINGFADQEIFGMAMHYYDEDEIKVGTKVSANVVVNHTIDLTEEEIQKAKKKALDEVVTAEKERLTKKKSKKVDDIPEQASLF